MAGAGGPGTAGAGRTGSTGTGRSGAAAFLRDLWRRPSRRTLFGAVYGTVLASSLAAALDKTGVPPNPGYELLWILVSALVSAAAHAYAHAIAEPARTGGSLAHAARSLLAEWPLVAAALPAVASLLAAHLRWWDPYVAVEAVLVLNAFTLFGLGVWAARVSGRARWAALRTGGASMLLGLFVVAANVLIK
ncbi:hypothetical protein AB0D67_38800 [Streptosporangium sp. NPDC048047]|uniref:hypothetical protein n=1 Tax=Streptosporangium sp. NPDC048047 TaxID=3155748 RepID=UPI00343B2076